MVSKNNRIKRMEEVARRQSHFGIRKLTVGAASVLLGITLLFGANAEVARADGTDGAGAANSVNGSTDEVVDPAEGRTPEQQGENPADDPSKATDKEATAYKNLKSAIERARNTKGSTDEVVDLAVVNPAEGRTPEQQDENPAAPSKVTDEEATAYKNLKSAIEQARNTKGLTVSGPYDSKPGDNARIPDELDKSKVGVIYNNEKLSAEDMRKQADEIQKKIKDYVENRNEFIQGLKKQGIYKDGDVDPTTLAQHLILQSEPHAKSECKIQDNNGNWTTAKENHVVTVTSDPHAPFVNDPNDPSVNPAYAVQLKNNNQVTGPIIQITYTNLEHSEYDGKPLGKIVETFSDVHATDINGPKAAFYISTNPTNGWLYTHCDGVTVTIQLYDNQAQPIKIDSSAYVSVSSLNSNGLTATPKGEISDIKGRTEAAQLLSKGSAMSIPESSVQVFPDNKVFSPSDNEDLLYNKTNNPDEIDYWGKLFAPREADWNKLSPDQQKDEIQKVGNYVIKNYSDWDNTGSKKIFGSALYKVEENPIVIRSYVIRNSSNSIPGYWFTYSTTVPQTSFDVSHTINYHFATAHATSQVSKTQESNRDITYVNRQGNKKVADPKKQKITFTGTATIDNITHNIVKVDKTGVITQVGDGKVDNINNYGNWTWKTNDGASGKGDSAEINDVISPTIKDMHVVKVSTDAAKDGKNVDPTTLKRGKSYTVVVTYDDDTENVNDEEYVTRKIHYTGAGKATPKDPDPEKVHFTGTGIRDKRTNELVKLDEDHHIVLDQYGKVVPGTLTWVGPNSEKDTGSWAGKPSPVVDGYHIKGVDTDSKNGVDVDPVDNFNHKKVGYTVTVTYESNGHIIPVDPNGNPIPGADTPTFPTDSRDPSKTIPTNKPDLTNKGYQPKDSNPQVSPDPHDPSKDVTVPYVPTTQKAQVTRTIHFVYENGQPADPDKVQTVDVTEDANGTIIDNPFKKYDSVTPRVIKGYVSSVPVVEQDDANGNKEVTVTYRKIGNIIPVDKDGSPIPNADKKPFDNDPNDPSKGVTTTVPTVPGKTPSQSTATPDPSDPTKDVTVPYLDTNKAGQVQRTIHYVYKDGGTASPDTVQTVNVTKNPQGQVVGEHDNYKAVKPPVINGYVSDVSEVPEADANGDKEVTVTYSKIGNIVPVDPTTHQPIPGATKKPLDNDPNDPSKGKTTTVPEVPGKKPSQPTADPDPNDPTKDVDIPYTDNNTQGQVTRKIHYVYDTGTTAHDDTIQSVDVTKRPDGSVIDNGQTYGAVVPPVIKGYVSNVSQVPSESATKDDEVTVTYKKIGNIVPVDPKTNQPIPGAPTKPLDNDPKDPSKGIPTKVPDVKGKTPSKPTADPDPKDPSKDVNVPYTDDTTAGKVSRTIHYKFDNGKPAHDDTVQSVDVTKDSNGNVIDQGQTYDAVKPPVIKGYVSNVSEVPSDKATSDKEYTVTYKKIGNIVPVDPKTNQAIPGAPTKPLDNDPKDPSKGIPTKVPDIQGKTPSKSTADPDPHDPTKDVNIPYTDNNTQGQVTRKIHYVYDTGTTAHDDTIQSVDVTKRPDGSVIDNGQTYDAVKPPVIKGYVSNVSEVPSDKATSDKEYTVTYIPDGNPGNPGNPGDQGDTPTPEPTPEPEPTPSPTPDDQPDSEISSDGHFENVKAKNKLDKTNPKKVDAYKKERKIIKTKIAKQGHTEIAELIEDKVTRENNVKVVSDPVENKAAEPKLPQTGEADNSIIGLLGMLLASFAAIFGFDSLHSHDKKHKN